MNFLFLNSARRGWGGNEKWTKIAAESLAGEHRVMLAYRDQNIGSHFNIEKVRLPFLMEFDLLTIAALVRLIRREHIDILIPTKRKDYLLAGIACRLTGKHNILRLGIDRPMKNTIVQKLIYADLADGIIVNAKKIKATLTQTPWIKPENVRVIYNGIDKAIIAKKAEQPYTKPFGFMVGAAGALIPRKGFDFLLRSFARFAQSSPKDSDIGLVIAGEGAEHPMLEQLSRDLGISDNVIFTGHLENPYPIMLAADVFVSASTSEGLANVLLESMILSSVPVSTFSGGADELIDNGKNGFLVDYDDQESLASIFSKLYTNPDEAKALAASAFKTVTNGFSMKRMSTDILEFCNDIVRIDNTRQ